MARNRQAMQFARQENTYAVQQYVGKHWSQGGTDERVPVNLLAQYVQVIIRNLISESPRTMLSTFQQQYRPHVSALESGVNRKLKKQNFADTAQEIAMNGLFTLGIGMVALAEPAQAANSAFKTSAGQVFWDSVDLDDFVFDLHAKKFSEASFIGHRFRAPIDAVKDSKYYTKARNKLEPSYDNPYNLEGDQRLRTLGRGQYINDQDEFEDMVDLWQVYLPRHKCIVTLADDQISGFVYGDRQEALRYQKWVGPDCGPYHFLAFMPVPGNAMPVGPILHLIDLHEAANRTWRKVIRMADDYKEITTYRRGYEKDAKRVFDASCGDMVPVDDPDAIRTLVMTGQGMQVLAPLGAELNSLFSRMAGNLDTLGGLSPQASTATQEKLLNQNSSSGIGAMQSKVHANVQSMVEAVCWYEHYHPENVHRSIYSPAGNPEFQAVRELHPAGQSRDRQGYPQLARDYDYDQMEIQVDPFSLGIESPETRIAKIDQMFQQILIPLMPVLQQQGLGVDFNRYLQLKSKYVNVPELSEFVNIQQPPHGMMEEEQDEAAGPSHQRSLPTQTNRTYTRQSTGQTEGGQQRARMAQLAGVDVGGASNNGQAA